MKTSVLIVVVLAPFIALGQAVDADSEKLPSPVELRIEVQDKGIHTPSTTKTYSRRDNIGVARPEVKNFVVGAVRERSEVRPQAFDEHGNQIHSR